MKIKEFFKNLWGGIKKAGKSFGRMFVSLFTPKNKAVLSVAEQEASMSPSKIIIRNFFNKKLSIVGIILFFIMLFTSVILPIFFPVDFNDTYYMQTNIAPGMNRLDIPSKLIEEGVEHIGVGTSFSAGLSQKGTVYVWGDLSGGDRKVPDAVKEANIIKISVGRTYIVALDDKNTVYIWGDHYRNTLEIKNIDSRGYQFTAEKDEERSIHLKLGVYKITSHTIADICAGNFCTSYITTTGELFNVYETNELYNSVYPDIQGHVKSVVASDLTFFAIMDDGTIYPMGSNGEAIIKYAPLEVLSDYYFRWTEEGKISITTGNGRKYYEDYLADCQRRNVEPLSSEEYFASQGTRKIKQLAVGMNYALILDEQGKMATWGDGGVEKIMSVPESVLDAVKNTEIVEIASGMEHFVIRTKEGDVYSWGSNDLKQLNMPKRMEKSSKVFIGYYSNYSIVEDGDVETWGLKGYLFGTDKFGRDLFKRIIHGGKMTMFVAAVAVAISTVIGLIIGLVAGYYGKWVDMLLMRFSEIIGSFPFLPLAMVLSAIVTMMDFGQNTKITMIMVVLGIISWPGLARMIRGQILSEKEKDFVLAAKALGIKNKGIMWRHILPNIINLIIVNATLSYAGTLLTEAGLSFLGFGVLPPVPSWGNLLTGAQTRDVLVFYWWQWVFPSLAVLTTALSINLIGDGLREAMDPKANDR